MQAAKINFLELQTEMIKRTDLQRPRSKELIARFETTKTMKCIREPGQDFRKMLAFLKPTTLFRHLPGYLEPQLFYKVIRVRPRTGIQLSHD